MLYKNEKKLPELVKQYLCYITTIKNRSTKTAEAYAIDLRNFFKFYKYKKRAKYKNLPLCAIKISDIKINTIKKITLLDAYEYLNFVMEKNNNSAKARARKISSIRGFFKYLTVNLRVMKENPVENLEMPFTVNDIGIKFFCGSVKLFKGGFCYKVVAVHEEDIFAA